MNERHQADSEAPVYSDFANDPEFTDLLAAFAETLPDKQRSLREAFRAADVDGLQTQAHHLKGAGGGYGFSELSALAAELELACRMRESRRINDRFDAVLRYLQRIVVWAPDA